MPGASVRPVRHGHAPTSGIAALTEREKQTLRLIVRGHDAKLTARSLGLSVHTINERLREARRKLAVSSSREAARLLLAAEGGTPEYSGDTGLREDAARAGADHGDALIRGVGTALRRPRILIEVLVMSFVLALLALTAVPTPAPAPAAAQETSNPEVVDAARRFLALVDQGRWDDSYRATGTAFRKLNTAAVWASVSERVCPPLGTLVSRTLVSQENLPARRPATRWSSSARPPPTRPTQSRRYRWSARTARGASSA